MRTRLSVLLVFVMVLTFVPLGPAMAEPPATMKAAKVTGTFSYLVGGVPRTMSLAIHDTDPLKGTWTWTHPIGVFSGPATCFRVDGDEAWMAGPSSDGTMPIFLYVHDGGPSGTEGDTAFTWGADPGETLEDMEALCEAMVEPPFYNTWPFDVVSGNVNVFDPAGAPPDTHKVAKVTGTYTYHTFHPTHPVRTVSISAHGTDLVKGTWSSTAFWAEPLGTTSFSGPVTCLQVDGDDAWLAGPTWDGSSAVFMRVHDGGTPGSNGDTAVTWYSDPGETLEQMEDACESMTTPGGIELPWFDVVSGNLNIWDVPVYSLILPTWFAEEDVGEAGQVLADGLASETGADFDVVLADSPRQMYDLMCAMPETAVGVGVNTLVYSFASEDCGVDASFKSIRFGYDSYWTQFLVPRTSPITDVFGLDGMSWAYPDASSVSGYYVSLAVMAEAGVVPGDAVERDGHDDASRAVYAGEQSFATTFYSPYIGINGNIGWDFDPVDADIPDAYMPDCHLVTAVEADGAFAEGDLVCGEFEVRDARRLIREEAPDIVQVVRILKLSPPIPNDPVAFGGEFPRRLRTQIEEALAEFADEAGPYFEEVWEPSLGLLYLWDGINPTDDSDWDWMRGALATAGFTVDGL